MGELFKSVAGVSLVHVPFKGMGQAAPELASGRVQLAVSTAPGVVPQVKAGRLRGIVSSGRERSHLLPDVQTRTEAGLHGFCQSSWHAMVAPSGTPKAVIARLHQTLPATLNNAELKEQLLLREDSVAVGSTPEQTAKLLRDESARFAKIIREAGIKGE